MLDGRDRVQRAATITIIALLFAMACIPRMEEPDVTGPEGPSDLAPTVTPSDAQVFEGERVELNASASGGTQPYLFRWDQNGGPVDVTLSDVTSATLHVEALAPAGQYAFRLTVTDAMGHHAVEYVDVIVSTAVETEVPSLAVVGEATPLVAVVEPGANVEFRWDVVEGKGTIADPLAATTTLTTENAGTVRVVLNLSVPRAGGAPPNSMREFEIVSVETLRPRVSVATSEGEFVIELDAVAAPRTVANFLLYVDDRFFDGLLFHRSVCRTNPEGGECEPFVLQGGGFERIDGELVRREPTRDAIVSEADNGLSNGERFSVAMALLGSDRDSAQTQFFVNLGDGNGFLDSQGFTVFGQVVVGTEVVDAIAAIPTVAGPVIPGENSLPERDVVMDTVARN